MLWWACIQRVGSAARPFIRPGARGLGLRYPAHGMSQSRWEVLDHDREIFDRELDAFVPDRIFDAHAHLYRKEFFAGEPAPLAKIGPDVDAEIFFRFINQLTPGRITSGLFFGYPHVSIDLDRNNRFVAEQVRRDPASRAQMLITPAMDPENIRAGIRREGFAGLKCYHVFSNEKPTFNATIPSYLPEEHVRIAHEERLSITLHMVRPRAMADPHNQEVIRRWAAKYPNARFILAHAARGFNPHHTAEGIGALAGLRNIWCDTSAITDSGAFEAIIATLGVDRLLYGSDFPVSHLRGRCVAIGDSFLWLHPENTKFTAEHAELRPTLVGLESLRVLKLACVHLRLKDHEIERIFYGNAAEMYSLP